MGSHFIFILILGLAPQALCFRLLRRLRTALFVQGLSAWLCTKSRNPVRRSANGAKYDSQGQAQSASPLVIGNQLKRALKVRNIIAIITLFQSFKVVYAWDPGATRLALLGACPWLSYSAPLALRGLISDFEASLLCVSAYL